MRLDILSAGAAQGVVRALEPALRDMGASGLEGSFGAVGAMREKLLAGTPCDVLILTERMIRELGEAGHVLPETIAPLGRVRTGIAVRSGAREPAIGDRDDLAAALAAADAIYFPDPERATAGIHFARVLHALGLHDELAERFHTFPNGAAAMHELAASSAVRPIGCTQASEILYTEGVELVGPLPPEFELATIYAAAVCRDARHPELAHDFVRLLAGAESRELRARGGFEA
jgi:molybdate transport system substrate-binding protein